MKQLSIALLSFLFSSILPANAACNSEVCTETIDSITALNGDAWISLTGDIHTSNCSPISAGELILKGNNPSYNDLYSMFLLAYTSSQRVRIRLSPDANGKCEIGFGIIAKSFVGE